MQCSNSQHLPFLLSPLAGVFITPTHKRVRAALSDFRKTPHSFVVHFVFQSFLFLLFHIAYSQQFIQSTVIIVLALQSERVRDHSSPFRRSCIKVHNEQSSSLPYMFICKYTIDTSVSINKHISWVNNCHNRLAWRGFDASALEGQRALSSRILPAPSGFGFKCTCYSLRAVVTFR